MSEGMPDLKRIKIDRALAQLVDAIGKLRTDSLFGETFDDMDGRADPLACQHFLLTIHALETAQRHAAIAMIHEQRRK